MSRAPRVVLVIDPRPGAIAADRMRTPGGPALLDLVAERATSEGGEVVAVPSGGAELAQVLAHQSGSDASPLCLLDASALGLPTTYGDLVADPRREPAVLETPDGAVVGVRLDGRWLLGGGSRATSLLGVLEEAASDAPAGQGLAALAEHLHQLVRGPGVVRRVLAAPFPLVVVTDPATLAGALAAEEPLDEAALRLRRASRADDGFLSTFLVRPLSRRLTRRAVARGVRPAGITGVSGVIGLLAAGAYALAGVGPSLLWRIIGSLLLLLSLVIDCVDGEVARYTRTFSPLGGWLDVGSDRLKEYAVYAGLAAGARPTAWGWASAAFAVLLVRHFVDFGYAATASGSQAADDPIADWSTRTSARPALMWAKRAVIMPVGERTIALAVLAPIVGARWTLGLLFAAGCVSAAYTLAGRVGRRLHARGSARWTWLLPAGVRAIEVLVVLGLVDRHRHAALAAAYAVVAAVAMHEYDLVYRRRLTGSPGSPGRGRRWAWPIRVVVICALALVLRSGALSVVLLLGAVVLLIWALLDSVTWWRRFVRSAWPAEGSSS